MRAIDGDHLKRWIIARWGETDPTSDRPLTAREILDQIDREMEFPTADRPTDDMVEVVRCKDCTHCKVMNKWFLYCTLHDIKNTPLIMDNFFCADGKRKEQNDEID